MYSKLILCLSVIATYINVNAQTLPPPPQNIADGLQQLLDNALPTNYSNPGAVLGVVVPGQWA
jgi:hypothetical protein